METKHNRSQEIFKNRKEIFKVIGNWSNQSQQLKTKFSQLTDTDLNFKIGQENDMLNRIGIRLNKDREEIIDIIKKGRPA